MSVLILDDIKDRHDTFDRMYGVGNCVHSYTYSDFLEKLLASPYDLIHLDHDLGDFVVNADTYVDGWGKTQEYNGVHAAIRICELVDHLLPKKVIIHSVNPEGARAMLSTLRRRGIDVTWEPFGDIADEEG